MSCHNYRYGRSASALPCSFKILDFPFVFFRRSPGFEGPQVLAAPGLGVLFARVQTVFSGFELSNHTWMTRAAGVVFPKQDPADARDNRLRRHVARAAGGSRRTRGLPQLSPEGQSMPCCFNTRTSICAPKLPPANRRRSAPVWVSFERGGDSRDSALVRNYFVNRTRSALNGLPPHHFRN